MPRRHQLVTVPAVLSPPHDSQVMLGDRIAQHMRVFAGDCVPKKKPAPDIYNLAAQVGLQCGTLR